MQLFLLAAGLTALFYAIFKIGIYLLRRVFPEGNTLFESVEQYLWVPAAMIALSVATIFARFGY